MRSVNIRFPMKDDADKNTYYQMTQITKDALASDLLLLLLTKRGERYMMPNYGTDLLKFVFEPNDSITSTAVEADIKSTVASYIPNLTIDRVSFNEGENESTLNVNIKFTYSEDVFSESGELDLNF